MGETVYNVNKYCMVVDWCSPEHELLLTGEN